MSQYRVFRSITITIWKEEKSKTVACICQNR